MKKILLLMTLVLLYTFSFSQSDLKRIVLKDKTTKIVEKFYVVKNNKSIKQGKYEKYYKSTLLETGEYFNSEKVGSWKYFNNLNELELEYNYDTNGVIYFKDNSTNSTDKIDQPPLILGNSFEPRLIILHNLRYPIIAQENRMSGRVLVQVHIDENGEVTNYSVKETVYPALDKEAIRVVKLIKCDWIPAIDKGNKIKSIHTFPIIFQL